MEGRGYDLEAVGVFEIPREVGKLKLLYRPLSALSDLSPF